MRRPILIDPIRPRYLQPPQLHIRPHGHMPGPPTPTDEPTLPLFGLIWYTWDQGNPGDLSALTASTFQKGLGWAVIRDALVARITGRGGNPAAEIDDAGQLVQLSGEVIIDLASMLDVAAFGHWPPAEHIAAIKGRSTAPHGTKVVCWGDFQSASQSQPWVPGCAYVWDILDNAPLAGDGPNGYGCTVIDGYELAQSQPGCPHTPAHGGLTWPGAAPHDFHVDTWALTGGGQTISVSTELLCDTYQYGLWMACGGVPDGLMLDNLLTNPYKAQATNNFPAGWASKYVQSWHALLQGLQHYGQQIMGVQDMPTWIWANGPTTLDVYPAQELRQRYIEHMFRTWAGSNYQPKPWVEIQTDLHRVAEYGLTYILGVLPGEDDVGLTSYWALTTGGQNPQVNGTWAQVVTECRQLGVTDQVLVPMVQTFGLGSYAILQAGWRTPT